MGELDPTQSASDAQAIAEFCQYELVTLTQVDAHRVKATFQDSSGNVESVMGSSVVSVLLAVARRQKPHAYLRDARAAEQQLIDALQTLPVPLTITKRREQGYTWEALTRTGTAYTLIDAISRGLEAMIAQVGYKPIEEQQ